MVDTAFPVLLSRHGGSLLLRALQKHQVEFVVIGGTALALYGFRELTDVGDLDLLIKPTKTDIVQLRKSIADLGFLELSETASWNQRFNRHIPLKTQSYFCDLLTPESVEDFEALSVETTKFNFEGSPVPFASCTSLHTLIKRALANDGTSEGRQRDLAAIESSKIP
jgi:hypothetical protein